MPMRASVETSVALERAWAWWTDYGPVGSEQPLDHGMGRTVRRVRARDGRRVEMEERIPLPGGRSLPGMRHAVEVDEAGRRLVERGPLYESRWSFEATPAGGTRITRVLEPKALGRLAPDGLSARMMERDIRSHVREMEDEVGAR